MLTDSELLRFVTDKTSVISMLSFVSFMLMPAFLVRFISCILGEKRSFRILWGLYLLVAALYLVNTLTGLLPGYILLLPTHVLCVCSVVIVIKSGVEELKRERRREIHSLMIGFILLSAFVAAALLIFYRDPVSPCPCLYCIGVVCLILCLLSAACTKLYGQVRENARAAAYRRMAYTDMMTGMGNRAAFMEEERRLALRAGLAYVLFDINDLKQINDRYGHQEGDRLITAAAACIRDIFAAKGICCRVGGDEFVAILRSGSPEEIAADLERLAARTAEEREKTGIPLEIAAGYALWEEGETAEDLYRRADAGMYEDKQRMKGDRVSS